MTALEKLQLRDAVPSDEICRCAGESPFHLRYAFTEFPAFCCECNGQVLPTDFDIGEKLAGDLVRWRDVYAALYSLWLDSGDYEQQARSCLLDRSGQVNVTGVRIAHQLGGDRECFYWFFRDVDDLEPQQCPLCNSTLQQYSNRDFQVCRECGITI